MIAPLEIENHDEIVLVRALGDVDLASADSLRDGCLAAVTNDSTALVVDLTRSEYVDSAGIRALFGVAKRLETHRQQMALVVPSDAHIRRVLAVVDMQSSAPVYETTDAAFGALRAPARQGAADA